MTTLSETQSTPREAAQTAPAPQRRSTCPICGSANARDLFVKHGYNVARCGTCEARFLNPQPDDATLAKIYDAHYFLGEPTPEAEARVLALKRATAALYIERLAGILPAGSRRSILEVGCGRGELLLEAQGRGFEVSGIEFSPDATAAANRRLGAEKVQAGTIESARFPEASFDAVVFADVIEHVREPLDFLRRVHGLLKPGGIVFLATPSLDSWSAKLLGRNWMEYKTEHLYYFGRHSIRLALEKTGFRDIAIAPNVKVLSFDYIHHHFVRYPVPGVTLAVKCLRALTPGALAHRHVRVVASGMIVTARKP